MRAAPLSGAGGSMATPGLRGGSMATRAEQGLRGGSMATRAEQGLRRGSMALQRDPPWCASASEQGRARAAVPLAAASGTAASRARGGSVRGLRTHHFKCCVAIAARNAKPATLQEQQKRNNHYASVGQSNFLFTIPLVIYLLCGILSGDIETLPTQAE